MTYSGVNTLFDSPAREDGSQKCVDFAASFWHVDCVRSIGLASFTEYFPLRNVITNGANATATTFNHTNRRKFSSISKIWLQYFQKTIWQRCLSSKPSSSWMLSLKRWNVSEAIWTALLLNCRNTPCYGNVWCREFPRTPAYRWNRRCFTFS